MKVLSSKQLDGTAKDIEILQQYKVPYQLLDWAGYLRYEPALADMQHKLVGALRLPGDETSDCFTFTNAIAELAKAQRLRFRFGAHIRGLSSDGASITGVRTDSGLV